LNPVGTFRGSRRIVGFLVETRVFPVVAQQSRWMGRARFHVVPASRTRGGRSLACPTHPPRPLPVSTALAAGPTGPRGIPSSSTPFRAPPSEAEPPDDVPRPTGADRILPRGIVRRAAPHGLRTLFPPDSSPPRQASPASSRAAFPTPRCRGPPSERCERPGPASLRRKRHATSAGVDRP